MVLAVQADAPLAAPEVEAQGARAAPEAQAVVVEPEVVVVEKVQGPDATTIHAQG